MATRCARTVSLGAFPEDLLHPAIATSAWADFRRGDYGTAVFKAFRDLEVAVREVARLGASDIGVNLMRKAFGDGGPLEDPLDEKGEQQALRELFAGPSGASRTHKATVMLNLQTLQRPIRC